MMTMEERIWQAKAQAEEEQAAQCRRAQEWADTERVLEALWREDAPFCGRVVHPEKLARYQKLVRLAHWLYAHCGEVGAIDAAPLPTGSPNGVAWVEIRNLSFLKGPRLRVFTAMQELADSVFFCVGGERVLRVSFLVMGVFQG